MTTPIVNKAMEVRMWIGDVVSKDGQVGMIDVRAQVRKRWPDLLPEIQEQIVDMALNHRTTFK